MDNLNSKCADIGDVCTICLTAIDAKKNMTVTTPCNHTIHFSCAILLRNHATTCSITGAIRCPTCRAPLKDLSSPARSVYPAPINECIDNGNGNGDPPSLCNFQNGFHDLYLSVFGSAVVVQSPDPDEWRQVLPMEVSMLIDTDPRYADGVFFLRHEGTKKYLRASESSRCSNQANLVDEIDARDDALWRMTPEGYLRHAASGMCLEAGAGDKTPGRMLWLWTIDGDPWQTWQLQS